MNKALLMVLSGVLTASMSSSWGMTQSEMEAQIGAQPGWDNKKAHNALQAFEETLKSEAAAKHTVRLENFGSFRAKESAGMRMYRNPRTGGTIEKEAFTYVKKPVVTSDKAFISASALKSGLSEEEMKSALDMYKSNVQTTLRQGGSVALAGQGTYAVGNVSGRIMQLPSGQTIRTRAHKKAKFKPYGDNRKTFDFKPADALNGSLN